MKTINIYKFEELTEQAKKRVWENSKIDFSDDYLGEHLATLNAFEKAFDIRIRDYDVEMRWFRYSMHGRAADAPEDDPLRVARYVWNNYAADITKGKYYSTRGKYVDGKYTYKCRHSKIILDMEACPLTGVCYDYDILGPVVKCLHYKEMYSSYAGLIDACLNSFFNAWSAEIEYCNSFEYFNEWAIENDAEWYTENGERVKGAA